MLKTRDVKKKIPQTKYAPPSVRRLSVKKYSICLVLVVSVIIWASLKATLVGGRQYHFYSLTIFFFQIAGSWLLSRNFFLFRFGLPEQHYSGASWLGWIIIIVNLYCRTDLYFIFSLFLFKNTASILFSLQYSRNTWLCILSGFSK